MVHVKGQLGVSERRACQVLAQPRSTQRRPLRLSDEERRLTDRITQLASLYGRYGYRRITALLRHEGWQVNHKRVERIWAPGESKGSPETAQDCHLRLVRGTRVVPVVVHLDGRIAFEDHMLLCSAKLDPFENQCF